MIEKTIYQSPNVVGVSNHYYRSPNVFQQSAYFIPYMQLKMATNITKRNTSIYSYM